MLPVVGGILFFVLLGVLTWGIAALLSRNPDSVNERLAKTTFDVGGTSTVAETIADSGPLLFQGLVGDEGERSIVLDHTGEDVRTGWRAYYASPADRPLDCRVTQIRRTRQFTDCEGRTLDVEDLTPPEGVRVLVGDVVTIDLTGATSGTAATPGTGTTSGTAPATTSVTTSGTAPVTDSSDAP